MKQYLLE